MTNATEQLLAACERSNAALRSLVAIIIVEPLVRGLTIEVESTTDCYIDGEAAFQQCEEALAAYRAEQAEGAKPVEEEWASSIALWENLEFQHIRCLREWRGNVASIYLRNDPRQDGGNYSVVDGSLRIICHVETRGQVIEFLSAIGVTPAERPVDA